ncbi:hypothetical protein QTP88_011565 [Uroleucon formosanum]
MESLKLLELKVRNSSDPVFCALIMDEMAIHQHLEYDRSTGKYYDRVDMGSGIDNDSLAVAKECLVFLVVSINENWKLPIGYFLAHSLNSAQKEQEGCHLANKLRKNHILFFKQKMKVKLATQLLSQSVADALKFCNDTLKLHQFSNAGATISFIELFNKAFDILNSRSINFIESKKALCNENIEEIKLFTNHFCTYIKGLKILESDNNFIPVLQPKRKTSFIGFIVSLNSLL